MASKSAALIRRETLTQTRALLSPHLALTLTARHLSRGGAQAAVKRSRNGMALAGIKHCAPACRAHFGPRRQYLYRSYAREIGGMMQARKHRVASFGSIRDGALRVNVDHRPSSPACRRAVRGWRRYAAERLTCDKWPSPPHRGRQW